MTSQTGSMHKVWYSVSNVRLRALYTLQLPLESCQLKLEYVNGTAVAHWWTVLLGPSEGCWYICAAVVLLQVVHKGTAHWQEHLTGWSPEWPEQCTVHSLSSRCSKLDILHSRLRLLH